MQRYFEESKDVDEFQMNYEDDDGETICAEPVAFNPGSADKKKLEE